MTCLKRSLHGNHHNAGYDDVRDHTLFDFNNKNDISLFLRETRRLGIRCNVCLFGADYIRNDIDMTYTT